MSQDTLSQMVTHIRNASLARHAYVTLDANKASYALARILKQNGYILGFKVGLNLNPTQRVWGQNQKAKLKLRLQTHARTLYKIERKLLTLLYQRRKLKSKLSLSVAYARRKVKKALRRARFLQRYLQASAGRKADARKRSAASNRQRSAGKRLTISKGSMSMSGRKQTSTRKRRSKRDRKRRQHILAQRARRRLGPKARFNAAQDEEAASQRTSNSKTSRTKRTSTTDRAPTRLHRRRAQRALRRVNLKHTRLQTVFRPHVVYRRARLKRPKVYLRGLRINARLCLRLQTQAAGLRLKVQQARVEMQTDQTYTTARKQIQIGLKYFGPYRRPALTQIKRVSRPSLRCYTNFRRIGRVHEGMGMTVLSTSQGLMSHLQAQRRKLGGEMILTIW